MAARARSASLHGALEKPLEPARPCWGARNGRSSPLGAAGALEIARARSEPQWRSKSLLEPASVPQGRSKWLLEPASEPQWRSKWLLEPASEPQGRSKWLVEPASELQGRSNWLLEPASEPQWRSQITFEITVRKSCLCSVVL